MADRLKTLEELESIEAIRRLKHVYLSYCRSSSHDSLRFAQRHRWETSGTSFTRLRQAARAQTRDRHSLRPRSWSFVLKPPRVVNRRFLGPPRTAAFPLRCDRSQGPCQPTSAGTS